MTQTTEKMKVILSKIPQFRFIPLPKYARYKYLLSDFSYGEMLLFEDNNPRFYLNLLDPSYKELSNYISQNGDRCDILEEIIKINKLNLTVNQNLMGLDLPSKEITEEIDLPLFPLALWENYKASIIPR